MRFAWTVVTGWWSGAEGAEGPAGTDQVVHVDRYAVMRAIALLILIAACGDGGAAIGEPCGGPDDIRCAEGGFCMRRDNTCDSVEMGVCEDGGLCEGSTSLVCGCNGVVYPGTCAASRAGYHDDANECEVPEGTIPCGSELCVDTELCNDSRDRCGTSGFASCMPRDYEPCNTGRPYCGCDGVVYDGTCAAFAAGTDVSAAGGCTAPDGMFACGPFFCDIDTQFCFTQGAEFPNDGEADFWMCRPLPEACGGVAACGCLDEIECTGTSILGACSDRDPGFRVTCPAD